MAEISRRRTINSSSREASSPYKIETKNIGINDTLKVEVDHESKPDKWIFLFNGFDLAGKDHIYFLVQESEGNTIIQWQGVTPFETKLPVKERDTITHYLQEYKKVVDEFLGNEGNIVERHYLFFRKFFTRDNLERVTWDDLKEMGNHIHSFNSMAIAKTNALGNPNQPIEKYREALLYLVFSDEAIDKKINRIQADDGYSLPYFGRSALSEIACYSSPDQYLFINSRDIEAAKFLGIQIKYPKKSRAGDKFLAFNNAIKPIFSLYSSLIGQKTKATIPLEVDQFFSWLYMNYVTDESNVELPLEVEDDKVTNYWIFAPGSNANKWDEFYNTGIMAIGWPFLGNLDGYSSKAELTSKFQSHENDNSSHVNDVNSCWAFRNEIKKGDIIIPKKGRSKYLGYGIVESDYIHDGTLSDFNNIRKVKWVKKGEWTEQERNIVLKTLTNITRYSDYVTELCALIGIETQTVQNDEESLPNSLDEPIVMAEILNEIFLSDEQTSSILDLIKRKKNVILQGPPGVGKTFIAKRLAYLLMGAKRPGQIELIQFHQSYSYEDFIQGFRPTESGTFQLKNGIFHDFCTRAIKDRGQPYFFVIDEINRGNLSKIFGELLMLIEHDKRGPEFAIPLTYSRTKSERFYIPDNVFIIGTMNTADRSLALVDFALRRRFGFVQMEPCFNDKFKIHLTKRKTAERDIASLLNKINLLNSAIKDDPQLGVGFLIGHSYFTGLSENSGSELPVIFENEIIPLIKEYWFDNKAKADQIIQEIR
jgi:5-methylcytosine-specific restriction protein B